MVFRASLSLLAGMAASVVAASGAHAAPAMYSTAFSGFVAGDVAGQNGWQTPSNSPTRGIVQPTLNGNQLELFESTNAASFGVSNGVNGPRVTPAGETGTATGDGIPAQSHQFFATITFKTPAVFIAPDPAVTDTLIAFNPAFSVSPTTADRYGFFGLTTDGVGGYRFIISPLVADNVTVLANVQPATVYTISEALTFVDGLNADGSNNDIFAVSVSGGGQSGMGTSTDWEDGYRDPAFAGVQGPLAVNTVDILNRFGPAGADEGTILSISYAIGSTAVPEPASMALLGSALGLAGLRRRKR